MSLSPLLKRIHVTNCTEKENSHLASDESIAIFCAQSRGEIQCHIDWHARSQNNAAWENARAFLGAKFCARPRVNVKADITNDVMCWRLPGILNFNLRDHPVINFELVNSGLGYKDVGSKFPFGMPLAGLPKPDRVEGQYTCEKSDEKGAPQVDNGVVLFTPRQERIFTTTLIAICILPFMAAWLGYRGWMRACWTLITSWWALIAAACLNLGGLWQLAH